MDEELRQKILEYVQSGQCPIHMLPIYKWWLQRRPEQICPDPIPTIWMIKAGRGCIAAGTPIWDPEKREYRAIETMTEPGWVLTTQGPAIASPSYIKGVAPLYRVETETGDVILTTAEHRFLTKRGYVPLREIEREDEILSLDPSKLPLDDQRLSDKVSGFQSDCHPRSHLCDLRPPLVPTSDRQSFPSPIGALEHSRYEFGLDDSKPSLEYIPPYPEFGPRSKSNCFLAGPLPEVDQLPHQLLSDERFQQRLLATAQFLAWTYPQIDSNQFEDQSDEIRPMLEVFEDVEGFSDGLLEKDPVREITSLKLKRECKNSLQFPIKEPLHGTSSSFLQSLPVTDGTFDDLSAAFFPPAVVENEGIEYSIMGRVPINPYIYYTTWERIRTVELVGIQEFYDLHVPGPNNYLAAGMFHKNSGKTFAASNHIYEYCVNLPWTSENSIVYVALVGAIFDDVKHTMCEGRSGLLNVIPQENLIAWNRTNGELKFFIQEGENYREVRANSYTAEKPEKLRGPNTHLAWLDEMAKFKDSDTDPTKAGTTWNNMMLGLRLGTNPHVVVTGTPTPCKLVRYLLNHQSMVMSEMTMDDNAVNLPQSFIDEIKGYGVNSRTYRQEAMGEVLFDNPDALFNQDSINQNRLDAPESEDPFLKVLGYDPSASSAAASDECGIVLCGYTPEVKQATPESGGRPVVIKPTHAYVMKDLSGHYTPGEQVQLVIQTMFNEKVNDLVFEQNQGVEFVMQALEQAIKDNTIEYKIRQERKSKKTDYGIVKRWHVSGVTLSNEPFKFTIYAIHAVSGKKLRAEMVSTRYDSNQVHHPLEDGVSGPMPTCEIKSCRANIEDQMTAWDPNNSRMSPDRLDAMVYCLLHIFAGNNLTRSKVTIARPPDINQMGSQHGAVAKRKSYAGIYSLDMQSDRLLFPMDMVEDRSLELYGRDMT